MRSHSIQLSLCVLFAILFVVFFFDRQIGLNLFLFDVFILGSALWLKRPTWSPEAIITVTGAVLSSFLVLWHNSVISIFVNLLFLIVATGVTVQPELKAMHLSITAAMIHGAKSQMTFFSQLAKQLFGEGRSFRKARTLVAILGPVGVIFTFILIYETANPIFEGLMAHVHLYVEKFFTWLWTQIDPTKLATFIAGLFIANFILLKTTSQTLTDLAITNSDRLLRKRTKHQGLINKRMLALKSQYRNGVFLLAALNILLLLINVIDVNWVWFGFEFQGEYLKQFVHEGTWMLIFSILLSVLVVLYYFNGNLNFFPNNTTLKRLAYIWIAQNMILLISVAIRNYWYIHYFGLAYKRIGVIFFLLATIMGLAFLLLKVKNKLSFHYMLRNNVTAGLLVLLLMACFNWDVIIARYNLAHADRAFVHLNFLSEMSDKALPFLITDKVVLDKIVDHNRLILAPDPTSAAEIDSSRSDRLYFSTEEFIAEVEKRRSAFIDDHDSRDLLEWNYADHRARKLLALKGY